MKYAPINRVGTLGLALSIVLLVTGCSGPQKGQTVPTAVVYDRALDVFRVEVEAVVEGEEPEYPDTLAFFTLIDGERREGLIPPAEYHTPRENGRVSFWRGPWWIRHKDSEWLVYRMRMSVHHGLSSGAPLGVSILIKKKPTPFPPDYFFDIDKSTYSIPRH